MIWKNKKLKKRFCMCLALMLVMVNFMDQPYICAAFGVMASYAEEYVTAEKATPSNATPSNASPSNAQYKVASSSNAIISVFSENEEFLPGTEVVLDLEIQNTSNTSIKDAILTYKAKGLDEDGFFEEMENYDEDEDNENYVNKGPGVSKKETVQKADEETDAYETDTDIADLFEGLETESQAEAEESSEEPVLEGTYDDIQEERGVDETGTKVNGIKIQPGEVYKVRFYYTIPEDADVKSYHVDFKLSWKTQGKSDFVKKSFYYNVGSFNLDTIRFTEYEEEDCESRTTRDIELCCGDEVEMEYFLSGSFLTEDDMVATPSEVSGIRNVEYEITMYDLDCNPFETVQTDRTESAFGLKSVYMIPEECNAGIYYGTVTASMKFGRKSMKSTQDFKFTVTDEEIPEVLSCMVNGVEIRIENPQEAFEGHRVQDLDLRAEELTPQEIPATESVLSMVAGVSTLVLEPEERKAEEEQCRIFKVRVIDGNETEVQPEQPATLSFNGVASDETQAQQLQLFQISEELENAVALEASVGEEGEIKTQSESITTYALAADNRLTGLTLEEIQEGLKDVIDFSVFAEDAWIHDHMEGNIAVKNLNKIYPNVIGNTDKVYDHVDSYEFIVEKNAVTEAGEPVAGTYNFGIYKDKNAEACLGKFSIATDENGYGQITSEELGQQISGLKLEKDNRYYVYELDAAGKPVLENGNFEDGSNVISYEDNIVSSSSKINYVEKFGDTVEPLDDSPWQDNDAVVYLGSGYRLENDVVYDNTSNKVFKRKNNSEQKIFFQDPWVQPDWEKVFKDLTEFSGRLSQYAGTAREESIRVIHVKAEADSTGTQGDITKSLAIALEFKDQNDLANLGGIPVSKGQCLIINVDCNGLNSVLMPGNLKVNGEGSEWNTDSSRILWNFHEGGKPYTGEINARDKDIPGTILAPAAMAYAKQVNGAVYARAIDKQGGEIHKMPFPHTYCAKVRCTNTIASNGDNSEFNAYLPHKKQIDYLGDSQENTDTTLKGDDFYRLYLDITGSVTPVDVMFLIDNSGSMQQNNVGSKTRIKALNDILVNSGTSSPGIINTILADNENRNEDKKNRVSVCYFSGPYVYYDNLYYKKQNKVKPAWNSTKPHYYFDYDTGHVYGPGADNYWYGDAWIGTDWVSSVSEVKLRENSRYDIYAGTNLQAGLIKTGEQLNSIAGQDNGRKKILIVLTDGVPTFYINSDTGERNGSGFEEDYKSCIDATKAAIRQFQDTYSDTEIYSIGIGITKEDAKEDGKSYAVSALARDEEHTYFAGSSSTGINELKAKLNQIFEPVVTNVTITDKLSEYVDYYGEQPDVKVTMRWPEKVEKYSTTTITNKETVIWQGIPGSTWNSGNATYYDSKGNPGYLEDIVKEVTYDEISKEIKVVFKEDYVLDPQATYTLSFNVKTTAHAYEEYESNVENGGDGYGGVQGDDTTDYEYLKLDSNKHWTTEWINGTSVNKPGFHSNTSAVVNYRINGLDKEMSYKHPVIQVNKKNEDVSKVELAHKKQIDYLGDNLVSGKDNPDTTLDDSEEDGNLTDLYRLYLDISADITVKPIDVVLVIDNSNSMQSKDMDNNTSRAKAVVEAAQDFIEALSKTGNNKVSVIGYSGKYKSDKNGEGPENQLDDAWNVVNWTDIKESNLSYINAQLKTLESDRLGGNAGSGTNITQGLWKAQEVFEFARPEASKYMIFLSDGLPTYYHLEKAAFNKNNSMYYKISEKSYSYRPYGKWSSTYSLSDGDFDANGYSKARYGNGRFESSEFAVYPTKSVVDDFKEALPEVNIYSVGIEKDGTSLKDMMVYIASSEKNYFKVEKQESLIKAFHDILYPETKNVVIQDQLSRYVKFYGSQPDVKVTMSRKDGTGSSITLWQGNSPGSNHVIGKETKNNYDKSWKKIINEVTYIPDESSPDTTGTVTVNFNPEYVLDSDYVYTLSFNVEVTQKAYDEFAENNKTYLDEVGNNVIGDINTDYTGTGNATSSEKPGYHSNWSADVTYTVNDKENKEKYDHPVVQVQLTDLEIEKVGEQKLPLKGAEFELYEASGEWAQLTQVQKLLITDDNGKICFNNLKAGKYLLIEKNAPPGYMKLSQPVKLDLTDVSNPKIIDGESGLVEIVKAETDGTPGFHLRVRNRKIVELPQTGGPGDELYRIIGLLMMAVGIEEALRMEHRKRYLKGKSGSIWKKLQAVFGMEGG